jgi:release factor glutamine methyltransferase
MADAWTVLGVLDWTRQRFETEGLDSPRLDAELLLSHALELPRIQLYARFDQPLTDSERDRIRSLVRRRLDREPVAHILGRKEFWSLDLEAHPDALVPRPETEGVVERVLSETDREFEGVIVDVGTGSGAIALALASERPRATVWGVDRSSAALAVAARNVERLGLGVRLAESDLLDAAPATIDVVAANLPYIPHGDLERLPPEVRREPRVALDGGRDGLGLVRRLLEEAELRLGERGLMVLEVGFDQAAAVAEDLRRRGWTEVQVDADLAGWPRVVSGRRPVIRPEG